ncbi:MAG: helix-turn-helix domain-containing protein [Campylobacter sp.]|nr:helix-turn-helix domain-containing protein [Campylobacter sp.]
MNVKAIKTQTDYEDALKRVDALMCNAKPDTAAGDELEVLLILIEAYESKHYPINEPDPIEAIKFRMEQMGLKQKDLTGILGDRAVVSKILNGKRKLTADMIKSLHDNLKIPFESLFLARQRVTL